VSDTEWLADRFEANRARLRAVAYRMLGSTGEADEAVQEAWIRLSRSDAASIDNLAGWLTTVVARVSLDMLRARAVREGAAGDREVVSESDPEADVVLADSVGAALLVVLDTLTPAERLAFVLHDTFAVPFEDVGAVLGRSPDAAKQLASRARRKVQGSESTRVADRARQRELVEAFLAASRKGEFEALVRLLAPDAVMMADPAAVGMGAPVHLVGAAAVAEVFNGRAREAEPALIDGSIGFVWMVGGRAKVAWDVVIEGDRITHIEMLAGKETVAALSVRTVASLDS
jgi:RNA polymerase sigma-70 factor (ECF subfamily)